MAIEGMFYLNYMPVFGWIFPGLFGSGEGNSNFKMGFYGKFDRAYSREQQRYVNNPKFSQLQMSMMWTYHVIDNYPFYSRGENLSGPKKRG